MKKFCLLTAAALLAVAACSETTPAPADDDGGNGTGGTTNNTQGTPEANWTVDELTRITGYLASDEVGSRVVGSAGSQLAREFIIAEFQRCGILGLDALGGGYEQPITAVPVASPGLPPGTNVLGVIPGSDPNLVSRTIFLSGHYDTHPGTINGANDNAAAVATIIAVGCAFAANPVPKTIVIAAWDAEEPPYFNDHDSPIMGSRFYVANPVVPMEQVETILNLDPIGSDTWEGYARHIVAGSEHSPQLAAAVANAPIPEGLEPRRMGLHMSEEQPTGHLHWSDHGAFRDAGKPILWFANGLTKHYHEPTDTLDKLNFEMMSKQAAYLYAITKNLAESPDVPAYDPAGADFIGDATVAVELLTAALAPGGMMDLIGYTAESRGKLQNDLNDATAIRDNMMNGAQPSTADVRRLRDGIQHLMCYGGTDYPEYYCNLF